MNKCTEEAYKRVWHIVRIHKHSLSFFTFKNLGTG